MNLNVLLVALFLVDWSEQGLTGNNLQRSVQLEGFPLGLENGLANVQGSGAPGIVERGRREAQEKEKYKKEEEKKPYKEDKKKEEDKMKEGEDMVEEGMAMEDMGMEMEALGMEEEMNAMLGMI